MPLVTITERWTDATFSSGRLVGDAGSGAPSCFTDAKRSENKTCGGEERSDELEISAVSPGTAEAIVKKLKSYAAQNGKEKRRCQKKGDMEGAAESFGFQAAYMYAAALIEETFLLNEPKPDSKLVKRASGRRNKTSPSTARKEPEL